MSEQEIMCNINFYNLERFSVKATELLSVVKQQGQSNKKSCLDIFLRLAVFWSDQLTDTQPLMREKANDFGSVSMMPWNSGQKSILKGYPDVLARNPRLKPLLQHG